GAEEAAWAAAQDITADAMAFTAAVRGRVFAFLAALSRGEYGGALEALAEGREGSPAWTEEGLRERMAAHRDGHGMCLLDPEGRSMKHTVVDTQAGDGPGGQGAWRVR